MGDQNHLLDYMVLQEFPAGHTFIEHKTKPDGIYYIASGDVSVMLNYDDDRTLRLRRAGPGAVFGEMSLYAESDGTR